MTGTLEKLQDVQNRPVVGLTQVRAEGRVLRWAAARATQLPGER